MAKRSIAILLICFLGNLNNLPIAKGEVTATAINQSDYLYQPVPAGMFMAQETLFGFGALNPPTVGLVTTKGPDNVWNAIFQPCDQVITEDCVEGVASRPIGNEKWEEGHPTNWKPSPTDPALSSITYTEVGETQYHEYFIDQKIGYPRGGMSKVWDLPNAEHAGGTEYLLSIGVYYYKNENPPQITQSFGIRLTPVKFGTNPNSSRDYWPFSYGQSYEFPSDREYQVRVKLGKFRNELGGWYNGKILDPKIVHNGSTLTFSGAPTKTLVAHTGPISCENRKLSAVLSEPCKNRTPGYGGSTVGVQTLNSSIENALNSTALYPNGWFAFYEPLLKPIGYKTDWLVGNWGINSSGSCAMSPDSVAIVTSNAAIYSAFPPAWDSTEKTLSYKVGSLHYDNTGSLHRGQFNLSVPKSFAQCLWGSEILNAKASVSITNSDGTSNAATTTLTQENGMINFKVAGFTFSTPDIKVKLEVPAATPSPTASAVKTIVPKVNKIICIKGKLSKTVSGTKCPSGYKKKS